MAPFETPKYEDPLEEQKPKEGENTDKKLDAELEKKDNGLTDGMDLMAKTEINTIKSDFSADELNNPTYNNKFTKAQENLTAETKKILSEKGTPEEKTKALEFAFERFQEEIGNIKGTKEAQDAQRGTKQADNIEKGEKKNEKKSQDFKEALLKSIEDSLAQKLQTQKLNAAILSNTEQANSITQAQESQGPLGDVTLAFGPPGKSEKQA